MLTSAPQLFPMGAEKLLLLAAERPDQVRPLNIPQQRNASRAASSSHSNCPQALRPARG
jgi:hypothetical protein